MMGNDKELINRYIYEVTKRVPKEQRQEIEMELQELIEDMQESMTLDQIFEKLGSPVVFAKKFREDKNYVIGPEYYDNYIWVLSIVLICMCVGVVVGAIVKCIHTPQEIPYQLVQLITGVITGTISSIGTITLIFAFMERQKIKSDLKKNQVWNPEMLSPIPDKKGRISRGDCIASLVFTIIFAYLLVFEPQLFGAYAKQDGVMVNIPMFNLESWGLILPLLLLGLVTGFANELVRLVIGCYCKMVMWSTILANGIQLILSIIVLKVLPIWNTDFAKEVAMLDGDFKMKVHWQNNEIIVWDGNFLSNIILGIIVFAIVLEVGVAVYKTIRYDRDK